MIHNCLLSQVSKYIAWDYEMALDLLSRFQKTVAVIISGHDHEGGKHFDARRNLKFLTLKGAIETEMGAEAQYICHLNSTHLVIHGQGETNVVSH